MDITTIFEALVTLAVALVSAFVIPYIKSKHSAEELADFLKWVEIGVAAAEQLYESAQGADKKMFVLDYLADRGYSIDEDDMNVAVEAAVNKLHAELYGKEAVSYDREATAE